MLDAEAAAGMRRRPQPQPIAWDTQSHRHDRVHGKRALEIGDDLVGLFAGEILGDHDKAVRGADPQRSQGRNTGC